MKSSNDSPNLMQTLRGAVARLRPDAAEPAGQKDAAWYNDRFSNVPEYRLHYTESGYYFLWTVLVDRILRSRVQRILDLGCGPGQFASLLFDKGISKYRGLDLSSVSVGMARERCPAFEFIVADLGRADAIEGFDYDCVVTLEFLEHVHFDLDVVGRIRRGARVFATVPNFPYVSHVRHFRDVTEVRQRYEPYFSDFTVDAFLENEAGKTFFLIEGVKT